MEKYGAIVCGDCKVEMEKKTVDGEEEFVCPECGKWIITKKEKRKELYNG